MSQVVDLTQPIHPGLVMWPGSSGPTFEVLVNVVPDGFYSQLVWSARNVVDDLGQAGVRVPPEFDAFATGGQEDRAAAFAAGYAAASVAGCPTPPEIGG